MCYTFYLYHMLVISSLTRVTSSWFSTENYYLYYTLHLLILGPTSVVICGALFLLFEKPFMVPDWPTRMRDLANHALPRSLRAPRSRD